MISGEVVYKIIDSSKGLLSYVFLVKRRDIFEEIDQDFKGLDGSLQIVDNFILILYFFLKMMFRPSTEQIPMIFPSKCIKKRIIACGSKDFKKIFHTWYCRFLEYGLCAATILSRKIAEKLRCTLNPNSFFDEDKSGPCFRAFIRSLGEGILFDSISPIEKGCSRKPRYRPIKQSEPFL